MREASLKAPVARSLIDELAGVSLGDSPVFLSSDAEFAPFTRVDLEGDEVGSRRWTIGLPVE